MDWKKLTLLGGGIVILGCAPQEEKSKTITFEIKTYPKHAKLYLDGEYIGRAPKKEKVFFKDPTETHTLTVKDYGYKAKSKVLTVNSPKFVMVRLEPAEKRKIGYLTPEYREKGIEFKVAYEYGYKETIENSPNALQVRRIVTANNVNQLIGSLDEKNGILVYTLMFPKSKINETQYLQYLDVLTKIIDKTKDLMDNPSYETAKELYTYIKDNESTLEEIKKSKIVADEEKLDEAFSAIKEIATYITVASFFKEKPSEMLSKVFDDLNSALNTLEEVRKELKTVRAGEFYSELWMVNLKRGFVKVKLTNSQHRWSDLNPSITADGKWVYFSSNRLSNDFDIWRISTGGGQGITKVINFSYSNDMYPSVDAANKLIAYSSIPIGSINPQIWTVRTDGTLPSQLKLGDQPNMCRDGSKIVFVRKNKDTGKYQIWLMNSDGTGETLLSQDPRVNDMYPHFSPDCKWIVFTSDAGGNKDIYIMKVDGSQRTQLTTNPSVDIYPVWGDDGNIYFVSNRGLIWGIWSLKPSIGQR